jgi:hypothetical protein
LLCNHADTNALVYEWALRWTVSPPSLDLH